jgi:transcriptional regulator
MYLPSHFEVTDTEAVYALIREHPLGALVITGPDGLDANHIPFEIDAEPGPHGRLLAHVARANPLWRNAGQNGEVLVIFQGASGYITPSWYPTKSVSGKVVPTYNYAVVHAYGRVRAIEDREWLLAFVTRLTDRHESVRTSPWQVSDAPADYIEQMLDAIVGIEVTITRLVGKWKVSQNRTPSDRAGVAAGLDAMEGKEQAAMARLVRDSMNEPTNR